LNFESLWALNSALISSVKRVETVTVSIYKGIAKVMIARGLALDSVEGWQEGLQNGKSGDNFASVENLGVSGEIWPYITLTLSICGPCMKFSNFENGRSEKSEIAKDGRLT